MHINVSDCYNGLYCYVNMGTIVILCFLIHSRMRSLVDGSREST